MDFFNLDFNKLFLKKHGQNIYNSIIKDINKENIDANLNNINDAEIVFKVAVLDFFELDNKVIEDIVNDTMPNANTDVKNIKHRHKKSISTIKKYLLKGIE